jgi:flavin-dependent dehydrogenase
MTESLTCDVAVVGGGPGGSTAATLLARGGLRVALFERERFPRFHVGESLPPAIMLVLDDLGVRPAVEAHGFQIKYGATFRDEAADLAQTFWFLPGQPWPDYSYQVRRDEFDTLLLEHAARSGVIVHQPAAVTAVAFEDDAVSLSAAGPSGPLRVRAAMLVDASGRDGFLAGRLGRRERIPNLGKVALFAHFRGAARAEGKAEGNLGIHVVDDGWFWWIPLAGDLTSVGAVLHARTVRAWPGPLDALYATVIDRCPSVADRLRGARRVTPVHRAANFAYVNRPITGPRFLCVGDAITFVDPIFSGGVYIAMKTGQLAAQAILATVAGTEPRRACRDYERAVGRGIGVFLRFIHRYYEPAFLDLLMHPRNALGIYPAVLNVLAGGSFVRMGFRYRLPLTALFGLARANTWLRRLGGRPYRSRLEW